MRSDVPSLSPFAVGAVLLLLGGCNTPPEAPPPSPPEVVVETPTQQDVTIFRDFTGNTQATESVEIRARVPGFLESFHFEPAMVVNKGDLLFEIERAPYVAAKEQAAADLEASESYLRRAESDLERLELAVRTNAVSQQEVTRATAERDQARAAVLGAKAKLDKAAIDLQYTTIHSPIHGLVSRQFVDPGNLVGSGEPTLLASIFNIDPIHVYFEVNEQLVAALLDKVAKGKGQQEREALPVAVTMDGVEHIFDGEIDYMDPAADPDTGTLQMRAVVPNPDGRLRPGFFVRIRVPGREIPGALLVPETALSTDLGGRYLMLVDEQGLAEKRYVEPGQLEENKKRVVDGIEAGERFITEGLQRARPGMPVTVASM